MKLKTHKGVAKRFKLNKAGGLKHNACGRAHLLSAKSSKRKRHLRRPQALESSGQKRLVKRLLPYG